MENKMETAIWGLGFSDSLEPVLVVSMNPNTTHKAHAHIHVFG